MKAQSKQQGQNAASGPYLGKVALQLGFPAGFWFPVLPEDFPALKGDFPDISSVFPGQLFPGFGAFLLDISGLQAASRGLKLEFVT